MRLEQAKPLVTIEREDKPEVAINGFGVFKEQGSAPVGEGSDVSVYARSLLKPWQFLSNSVFGTENFWALGMASHSGEAQHMRALNELAKAEGLSLADLKCPLSYPMGATASAKLLADNRPKERVFSACSGKHLVFLAACKRRGLDKDYLQPTHPLQMEIIKMVEGLVGEPLKWAVDGCGLQTPYIAISKHLELWEKLALAKDEKSQLAKSLWLKNPELIGGPNRLDTEIMQVVKGQIIAKEGADGLLAVQTLASSPQEKVQGCFIKINSGYNLPFMGLALWAKLAAMRPKLNAPMKSVLEYLETKKEAWVPQGQQANSCISSL